MKGRDRLVLMALAALVVLGAVWLLVVSPVRKQATALTGEVSAAEGQLAAARSELAEASVAKQRYHSAYASLARLGQAVPTSNEVPSLLYTLSAAADHHKVELASLTTAGGKSSGSSGSASPTAGPAAAGAAAQAATIQAEPFTFTFSGTYQDLCRLLSQLEGFTTQPTSGEVKVNGRLLTIQSISLSGVSSGPQGGQSGGSGGPKAGTMTWTITATAYVLPPTPATPSPSSPGAASSGSTTTTSGGSPATASTPAVIRVNP